MCVIAYKPSGVPFMSKSTLHECFKNNPDGAGFMFVANGKVNIRKGFMSFSDFWSALNAVRNEYGDDIPYVMHFRISTQAGVNQQCCHPYPLSSNMEDLKKLKCVSNIGIAHNGVISLTSNRNVKDYNDTMKFITDYVTLLVKNVGWWKNKNISTALGHLCESKLAIMGSDSHVELIGDFIADEGCYYSNGTYAKPKTTWKSYSFLDEWEDYYNPKTRKYNFDTHYCPLFMDGDDTYCTSCSKCKNCPTLSLYAQDYDELIS